MNVLLAEKKRKKSSIKIPDYLIYEVVKGKPIYYDGGLGSFGWGC